jgi:hypothetical protein
MSNLTRFDKEGIEIIIDLETGEAFASISGYARMSGKTQQAISIRINNLDDVIEAEIQTSNGIRLHKLIPEPLIRKWIIKDNPEMAENGIRCPSIPS